MVMNTQLDRIVTMMNMLNNLLNSQGALWVCVCYLNKVMSTAPFTHCTKVLLSGKLDTVARKSL